MPRHSLRFRILAAFVIAGIVLGPLLVGTLLIAAYHLEERAVARILTGRLEEIMIAPDRFNLTSAPNRPDVRVYGRVAPATLPEAIGGWRPGLYEIEHDGPAEYEGPLEADAIARLPERRSWALAVAHRDGQTFVVAEDLTTLEYRESLTIWLVAGGTVLALYIALWLGYFLSRRLIEPLRRLALSVGIGERATDGVTVAPEDYPGDEVGELATAFAGYQQRMVDALERERAFSADASHELRNPLAVIGSSLEIAERDPGLSEATRRALARATSATREITDTVGALLVLAREGPGEVPHAPVGVAPLVAPLVERLAAGAGVPVDWETAAEPVLAAPEVAIRAVAENLIRNAVQHTREGRVRITLYDDRLSVVDSGVGIPVEEIERIRQRGVRGSNSLSNGSGLGLSIADRLCRRFGWRIEIDSTVGEGTRAVWHFA
ncbi:HAMP domain-containing histidine kinase [Arhodomonas aquaeolei]|uniref:sensor histidine kinase n=1 Tax=Arhodomonas aquaeolei TaxID=2369 RepID=UPI00216A8C33|nr:HAMP domain-containing sensor histidine kinase [Arhodomonas aquaeolei]MCS4502767.1 HAMP domain-containing histidine kinase [Arhodomonas aquaeolei]